MISVRCGLALGLGLMVVMVTGLLVFRRGIDIGDGGTK